MSKDKGGVPENNKKKCPECGSYSLIPFVYGLMSEEARKERGKKGEYAWGGCRISKATDYCKDCEKSFGGKPQKKQNSDSGSLFRGDGLWAFWDESGKKIHKREYRENELLDVWKNLRADGCSDELVDKYKQYIFNDD